MIFIHPWYQGCFIWMPQWQWSNNKIGHKMTITKLGRLRIQYPVNTYWARIWSNEYEYLFMNTWTWQMLCKIPSLLALAMSLSGNKCKSKIQSSLWFTTFNDTNFLHHFPLRDDIGWYNFKTSDFLWKNVFIWIRISTWPVTNKHCEVMFKNKATTRMYHGSPKQNTTNRKPCVYKVVLL